MKENITFTMGFSTITKMIEMKVSISRETGKYNPEDEGLAVSNKIILKPHEMSQTKKTRLVYDTDVNWGTYLVSIDDLPENECQIIEDVITGMPQCLSPVEIQKKQGKSPLFLLFKMMRVTGKFPSPSLVQKQSANAPCGQRTSPISTLDSLKSMRNLSPMK